MQSKPVRSSFPKRFLLLAMLAGIGLAAGYWSLTPSPQTAPSGAPPAGPAAANGPPLTVSAPLKRTVTDWAEFTGQFAPVEYVEMRARVSGYLTEIHFTDGQYVDKGDLLFVIDPRPYQTAVVSARAKLDQAAGTKEFAHRQLNRADDLRRRDFVAQSTLDQRVEESRGAGAGVEAARAAVRDAELNLEFTRVVAPVSGRISSRQVSVGNLVSGGGSGGGTATLLTTIVSMDPIYFNFDMSEADFLAQQRRIKAVAAATGAATTETPAQVRLSDETGWPHEGRLDFIDNQVNRTSGTIRARAVLANADHFITPGTFGRLRLAASTPYEALTVPDSAVVTDQSRKLLMTVKDGMVVPKPVVLGPLVDGLRVVRSGLAEDDQVVIVGLMRARPGSRVTPQPGTIEPEAKK
jgi:RND family efflux transporter MFP subunit